MSIRNSGRREGTSTATKFSFEAVAILAFRKILTDALKENELQNGFHLGQSDNEIDILIGFPEVVEGKSEFNDLLRQKKLFKDSSAGKQHGENSHRIQWYLITKMGTLAHSADVIYSKLLPWRTEGTSPRSFYLWEFLVDRDGVPTNAAVIPFKTGEQTDFLLTAVLSERWDRRDSYMMGNYLAKKVLPPQELQNITRELEDLLWKEAGPGGALRILRR